MQSTRPVDAELEARIIRLLLGRGPMEPWSRRELQAELRVDVDEALAHLCEESVVVLVGDRVRARRGVRRVAGLLAN